VSGACTRKKAATAATALGESAPPSGVVVSPEPAGSSFRDPLAGDLDSVNDYVRSSGLLRDVFYEYDSAELSLDAQQALAGGARFLVEHAAFEVQVEGHCDERGTAEYNLALGERRAGAARAYLTRLGVDGGRLRPVSFGEERPVCADTAEPCWSQNRRAHFTIVARRPAP
jgi:peptidoglycan-associated lipoprotein